MDESNATCGKRLDSIGVSNTVENRCVGAWCVQSLPAEPQLTIAAPPTDPTALHT